MSASHPKKAGLGGTANLMTQLPSGQTDRRSRTRYRYFVSGGRQTLGTIGHGDPRGRHRCKSCLDYIAIFHPAKRPIDEENGRCALMRIENPGGVGKSRMKYGARLRFQAIGLDPLSIG